MHGLHWVAEAPARFEVLAPLEELVECDDCIAFFGPGKDARSCLIQRLRFESARFEATVERIRNLVRSKGRVEATWEISTRAHSPSTIERLISAGMQRSIPSYAVIMALDEEPRHQDSKVVVSAVDTLEEFKVHVAITHEVFGMLDCLPAELERIEADGRRKLADTTFVRYIARVDGVPAGAATATFTAAGIMLHSGSTLDRFRRCGVYSALVFRRWLDAVSRGTPHMVTRAGPMSQPILLGLGFREIAEIHFLVDSIR